MEMHNLYILYNTHHLFLDIKGFNENKKKYYKENYTTFTQFYTTFFESFFGVF